MFPEYQLSIKTPEGTLYAIESSNKTAIENFLGDYYEDTNDTVTLVKRSTPETFETIYELQVILKELKG